MYAPYFGLQQEAFSIAPDPRFLHLSAMHREALAHLLYGLQGGGGFVLLTGEIGTGKTTVCRCFLEQIPPGHQVAYIYNPKLTPVELLQTVCQEFGITLPDPPPASLKPYADALNRHLLAGHAAGQQFVLIVDEAQALAPKLLEMLRLLTNLETQERKLLQIVLVGQPELRDMLARPDLEQLAQRVIARVHLGPMQREETAEYVRHRLGVAGLKGRLPFSDRALALVHRLSGGVPRRINLLCQRALLGAYATGTQRIGPAIVRQAAREVFAGPAPSPGRRTALAWGMVVGLMLALAAGAALWWWAEGARRGRAAPALPVAASGVPSAALAAGPASAPRPPGTAPLVPVIVPFADDAAAWSALSTLWAIDAADRADPCGHARERAQDCHDGIGDLALLRRLQRPVLLQLQAGGRVLLRSLSPESATLQGGAGEQRVTLVTLKEAWTGRFSTLWRTPPGWGERGDAGPAPWVLAQLTALQGDVQAAAARQNAAEVLRQRVFAFQVSQGLALDGLAGPLTLMQINRATGVDEPRLRPEP